MPLARQEADAADKPAVFSDEEIDQLMAYVQANGGGPTLPSGDLRDGDLAEGGELFRLNCASCHNFVGEGGALSSGKAAPSLEDSNDLEIYTAMLTGPENMPVFGDNQLTPEEKRSIINYVQTINAQADPGGAGIGRIGPVGRGPGHLGRRHRRPAVRHLLDGEQGVTHATTRRPAARTGGADVPGPAVRRTGRRLHARAAGGDEPRGARPPRRPVRRRRDPARRPGPRARLAAGEAGHPPGRPRRSPSPGSSPSSSWSSTSARAGSCPTGSGRSPRAAGARCSPRCSGLLMGLSLLCVGVGLVLFTKKLLPHETAVQDKHDGSHFDRVTAGATLVRRLPQQRPGPPQAASPARSLLMGGGVGADADHAARRPDQEPEQGQPARHHRRGPRASACVRDDGTPIRPGDQEPGSLETVFPAVPGGNRQADAATMLIRLRPEQVEVAAARARARRTSATASTSPTPRSARTPAARSRSTSRRPAGSSAPATSRSST